jgi:hypothetical protein
VGGDLSGRKPRAHPANPRVCGRGYRPRLRVGREERPPPGADRGRGEELIAAFARARASARRRGSPRTGGTPPGTGAGKGGRSFARAERRICDDPRPADAHGWLLFRCKAGQGGRAAPDRASRRGSPSAAAREAREPAATVAREGPRRFSRGCAGRSKGGGGAHRKTAAVGGHGPRRAELCAAVGRCRRRTAFSGSRSAAAVAYRQPGACWGPLLSRRGTRARVRTGCTRPGRARAWLGLLEMWLGDRSPRNFRRVGMSLGCYLP